MTDESEHDPQDSFLNLPREDANRPASPRDESVSTRDSREVWKGFGAFWGVIILTFFISIPWGGVPLLIAIGVLVWLACRNKADYRRGMSLGLLTFIGVVVLLIGACFVAIAINPPSFH